MNAKIIKEKAHNSIKEAFQRLKIGILVGEINEYSQQNVFDKEVETEKPNKAETLNRLEKFKSKYTNESEKLLHMDYIQKLWDDYHSRNDGWEEKELIHLFNESDYDADRTYRKLLN